MKLLPFICTSSVILSGWMLVTFIHEVSPKHYPKLRKQAASSPVKSTANADQDLPPVADATPELGAFSAELSR